MNIKSEQEMLNFGKQFALNQILGNLNSAIRGISRPTGSELARSPVTTAPWDADDPTGSTGATKRAENGTIQLPYIIELIGDVGVGKTTFTRGLAEGLGIKEPITSPSFTISKSYALPTGGNLIHYDFYRLPDPGLMANDLQDNLTNPKNIIVIEWGESVSNLLPDNHTIITIEYNDDNTRTVNVVL